MCNMNGSYDVRKMIYACVVQLYISHNKYIIIYNGRATFCTCKNVYINVYDVFMYYVELCYFIAYYDMQ